MSTANDFCVPGSGRVSDPLGTVLGMSSAATLPPTGSNGPEVARCLRQLREATERLSTLLGPQTLPCLDTDQVAEATVELHGITQRLRAGTWAGLARVADSGWVQQQQYVSAGMWWQDTTRLGKDEARTQVRLARRLARHYARTGAAWSGGRIHEDHVRIITGGIDAILHRYVRVLRRDGQDLPAGQLDALLEAKRHELESVLLALAEKWGPEALRVTLARARIMVDPDGASDEQMRRELEACLKIEAVGDMAVLTGQLSLELADKLRLILDHYRTLAHHRSTAPQASTDADADADGDADRADGVDGADGNGNTTPADDQEEPELDPVTGDPIIVSNARKDAAALEDWINATLDAGLGTKPVTERPHLDIVITAQDLLDGTGPAILSRTNTPVPAATAQRCACDAIVRVVITDGIYRDSRTGEVLDPVIAGLHLSAAGLLGYGRAHRIVPTKLRRALAFRDRGCAFPGCHRPPAHTEAHHILPWQHGGETCLANTVLLCSRHHHYVHEGGWRITLRAGMGTNQSGCWLFTPPDRMARL